MLVDPAWEPDLSLQFTIPNKQYIDIYIYIYWLVVLTILKNMKVNGKDYPIYYGKNMFETTNQTR